MSLLSSETSVELAYHREKHQEDAIEWSRDCGVTGPSISGVCSVPSKPSECCCKGQAGGRRMRVAIDGDLSIRKQKEPVKTLFQVYDPSAHCAKLKVPHSRNPLAGSVSSCSSSSLCPLCSIINSVTTMLATTLRTSLSAAKTAGMYSRRKQGKNKLTGGTQRRPAHLRRRPRGQLATRTRSRTC